jgi:hypothetical protein
VVSSGCGKSCGGVFQQPRQPWQFGAGARPSGDFRRLQVRGRGASHTNGRCHMGRDMSATCYRPASARRLRALLFQRPGSSQGRARRGRPTRIRVLPSRGRSTRSGRMPWIPSRQASTRTTQPAASASCRSRLPAPAAARAATIHDRGATEEKPGQASHAPARAAPRGVLPGADPTPRRPALPQQQSGSWRQEASGGPAPRRRCRARDFGRLGRDPEGRRHRAAALVT